MHVMGTFNPAIPAGGLASVECDTEEIYSRPKLYTTAQTSFEYLNGQMGKCRRDRFDFYLRINVHLPFNLEVDLHSL